MKELVKRVVDGIPYSLGKKLSRIPMQVRLGNEYSRHLASVAAESDTGIFKEHCLQKVRNLVRHAITETRFYREFYSARGFDADCLETFSDISLIPVLRKEDLRTFAIQERSDMRKALKRSNTGGTSGQPLSFYLEKGAYAKEWSHMHAIWGRLGYAYSDEKITVRGRNIGSGLYKYRYNQNEFIVNSNASQYDHLDDCRTLVRGTKVRWIHGYPSAIVSFLKELEAMDAGLFQELLQKLRGVFLGSEFPAPQYRAYLEDYCGLPTIAWYGHSEMCVLAPEDAPGSGIYHPFRSYGYSEAVEIEGRFSLVATSFSNFASPFIRYDTGDIIEPTISDGILASFAITEGRSGDNVVDLRGRAISITGLIFGRHHAAFDVVDHVQVRQLVSGCIEILVVASVARLDWAELFDFSNTNFNISYRQIAQPIRTQNGKISTLVRHS